MPSIYPKSANNQPSTFHKDLKIECHKHGLNDDQTCDFIAVFESKADQWGLKTLIVESGWEDTMLWVKYIMLNSKEGLKDRDLFSNEEIKKRAGAGATIAGEKSATK